MSKKFLVNFIIWMLLQILVEVDSQMTLFEPSVSTRHTATLIDNKLYILGGETLVKKQVKEFFYLDVSVPFNTQKLSWQDLSNINIVPLHSSATSAKGGANNNTLFLFGGSTTDITMALVYAFDSRSIAWSIPKIAGTNTIVRKDSLTGIINYNRKFYLWSGTYADDSFSNEMLILDTINFNWEKGSILNAPTPRFRYSAVLLPDNKIIYIGGTNNHLTFDVNTLFIKNGIAFTLSEIYIYDTINDNWSTKVTSGKIPSNRVAFSSILGFDGRRIIIYGGAFSNPGYKDTTLYVLDIENYNWYVPKISGKIPAPRVLHQANLIGKYMVISFGFGYDRTVESDILLLDISNNEEYVWTTSFDPSVPNNISSPTSSSIPSQSLSSSSDNSSNNSHHITGTIVGSLLSGILLLFFGIFFIHKWNKNKQNQKIIHGNENYNNYRQEIPTERNYEQAINNNEQNIIQINDNATNYEPTNDYHGQEIIQINDNTTVNYEPTNDHHGQEIILTSKNESMIIPANDHHEQMQKNEFTTNHEPIISESVNNKYNDERFSLQAFKDEMLQAVKQENQNLRNEILQVVKENYNNKKNNLG